MPNEKSKDDECIVLPSDAEKTLSTLVAAKRSLTLNRPNAKVMVPFNLLENILREVAQLRGALTAEKQSAVIGVEIKTTRGNGTVEKKKVRL